MTRCFGLKGLLLFNYLLLFGVGKCRRWEYYDLGVDKNEVFRSVSYSALLVGFRVKYDLLKIQSSIIAGFDYAPLVSYTESPSRAGKIKSTTLYDAELRCMRSFNLYNDAGIDLFYENRKANFAAASAKETNMRVSLFWKWKYH